MEWPSLSFMRGFGNVYRSHMPDNSLIYKSCRISNSCMSRLGQLRVSLRPRKTSPAQKMAAVMQLLLLVIFASLVTSFPLDFDFGDNSNNGGVTSFKKISEWLVKMLDQLPIRGVGRSEREVARPFVMSESEEFRPEPTKRLVRGVFSLAQYILKVMDWM